MAQQKMLMAYVAMIFSKREKKQHQELVIYQSISL